MATSVYDSIAAGRKLTTLSVLLQNPQNWDKKGQKFVNLWRILRVKYGLSPFILRHLLATCADMSQLSRLFFYGILKMSAFVNMEALRRSPSTLAKLSIFSAACARLWISCAYSRTSGSASPACKAATMCATPKLPLTSTFSGS